MGEQMKKMTQEYERVVAFNSDLRRELGTRSSRGAQATPQTMSAGCGCALIMLAILLVQFVGIFCAVSQQVATKRAMAGLETYPENVSGASWLTSARIALCGGLPVLEDLTAATQLRSGLPG